jgi:homoserine acetyltransferase
MPKPETQTIGLQKISSIVGRSFGSMVLLNWHLWKKNNNSDTPKA